MLKNILVQGNLTLGSYKPLAVTISVLIGGSRRLKAKPPYYRALN
jgi:hypothetical protein